MLDNLPVKRTKKRSPKPARNPEAIDTFDIAHQYDVNDSTRWKRKKSPVKIINAAEKVKAIRKAYAIGSDRLPEQSTRPGVYSESKQEAKDPVVDSYFGSDRNQLIRHPMDRNQLVQMSYSSYMSKSPSKRSNYPPADEPSPLPMGEDYLFVENQLAYDS